YGALIYSIALKSGLDADDAADVFQKVCVILLEKLPTLRQPNKLHGWLVRTAQRESWRLRRLRGAPVVGLDDLSDKGEHLADSTCAEAFPDKQLLLLEQQHRVREGIRLLGPRCQKLLWSLFYSPEPLSHLEIGRRLEISSSSVGRMRARCLERLRAALSNLDF
ncbi:MAG: sigma-70 family RNA polymerase sigma factor, partial [Acidobacteria bacterium]|nr:sigma-70 family RNA polymerase sigma factor [Acidobacteriota bacterium]